jgi:hypothetical protein
LPARFWNSCRICNDAYQLQSISPDHLSLTLHSASALEAFVFGYLRFGTATVIRQWRLAKVWLYGEINKTLRIKSSKVSKSTSVQISP